MRLLICGSRGWHNPEPIEAVIENYRKIAEDNDESLTVIEGDAAGADRLAKHIARRKRIDVITEPAQWNVHGKAAGPIRNQKMLDEHKPDAVYAFRSTGKSNGTDDMVRRSQAAGVPTFVVNEGDYFEWS